MPQRRLHSLDALRGIAALAVVLWHWQHFATLGGAGWPREAQPFYALLKPGYLYGWIAVDLFFALSGFVFFWLYADAIAARRMTPGRFALLRFSRLYPLHWLTLAAVAILQWTYHRNTGTFFIYQTNDLMHFAASIALAQNWFHGTESFNGPSWSISVEVLLYIVFFVLCRLRLINWQSALAMVLVGFAIRHFHLSALTGRGVMAFFIGGIAFHVTEWIRGRADAVRLSWCAVILAAAVWMVAIAQLYWPALGNEVSRLADLLGHEAPVLLFVVLVGAPTLVALALHEQVLRFDYSKLSLLGDISYSTYLLHFPLQLLIANIAVQQGWAAQDFMSPLVLVAFYAVLIGLGTLS
ncbi:MAG TPA: acyltransferase, partial [Rhizomicrobium sp.]